MQWRCSQAQLWGWLAALRLCFVTYCRGQPQQQQTSQSITPFARDRDRVTAAPAEAAETKTRRLL